MNYSMCNCRYTHICYTVVINTHNEFIFSLLGLLLNTLMAFTLHNHTSGVRGSCSTTDEMPLWLLYTIFPLWNCKVTLMAFVRYVSIRPESLAAR